MAPRRWQAILYMNFSYQTPDADQLYGIKSRNYRDIVEQKRFFYDANEGRLTVHQASFTEADQPILKLYGTESRQCVVGSIDVPRIGQSNHQYESLMMIAAEKTREIEQAKVLRLDHEHCILALPYLVAGTEYLYRTDVLFKCGEYASAHNQCQTFEILAAKPTPVKYDEHGGFKDYPDLQALY